MNWLVFGDDWGRHPSTIQHVVARLPETDRVVWINSIGMRSPAIVLGDFSRLADKVRRWCSRRSEVAAVPTRPALTTIHPRLLPWHMQRGVVRFNELLLGAQVRTALRRLDISRPSVLTTNPIALRYLKFPIGRLGYLRVDDYAALPGVDPDLIHRYEPETLARADLIFATARTLMPLGQGFDEKCMYLPQGVDLEHFATVPLMPPRRKVLGFFGLLAEWIDYKLVEDVAHRCRGWTLEFLGPVRHLPARVHRLPNVRVRLPHSYSELPAAIAGWDAAWIPFEISTMTTAVNPLKLREYLAAGLPTLSTAIPEASAMPEVEIVATGLEVEQSLARIIAEDSVSARRRRRVSVVGDSWTERALRVRSSFLDLGPV